MPTSSLTENATMSYHRIITGMRRIKLPYNTTYNEARKTKKSLVLMSTRNAPGITPLEELEAKLARFQAELAKFIYQG